MEEESKRAGAEIIFGEGAHQWALARAFQRGRDEERERCAKVCEELAEEAQNPLYETAYRAAAKKIRQG